MEISDSVDVSTLSLGESLLLDIMKSHGDNGVVSLIVRRLELEGGDKSLYRYIKSVEEDCGNYEEKFVYGDDLMNSKVKDLIATGKIKKNCFTTSKLISLEVGEEYKKGLVFTTIKRVSLEIRGEDEKR